MRIGLSLILCCLFVSLKAQTTYIGRVIDIETNLPVSGVVITIDTVKTKTNSKGFFQITSDSTKTLTTSIEGYEASSLKLPSKNRFSFAIKRSETPNEKELKDSFYKYFSKKIKYPPNAWRSGTQGMVVVYFKIDTLGKVLSVDVINEVEGCTAGVIEVLKRAPEIWYSVKRHTYFALPVIFKIDGYNTPKENPINIPDGIIKIPEIIVTAFPPSR